MRGEATGRRGGSADRRVSSHHGAERDRRDGEYARDPALDLRLLHPRLFPDPTPAAKAPAAPNSLGGIDALIALQAVRRDRLPIRSML